MGRGWSPGGRVGVVLAPLAKCEPMAKSKQAVLNPECI